MLEVANLLLPTMMALWWPFCRIMAMLSTAPVIGEGMVPLPVRALLSVVLAFLMLPVTKVSAMPDAFSLAGVVAMLEQAVIGGVIGIALQLTMAVVGMLGFLSSSQIGFSMAQMNDPINGQQSDVVSSLLGLVSILVFFAIDGHLVLAGVMGQSFKAWPVGGGFNPVMLETVALNVGWVFSAAVLLALPIVFSTLVVQIGFGFLNRVAPSLNLFSLGFSLVTLFGLMMLVQVVRFIPEHYVQMTNQILEMLQQQMRIAHGGKISESAGGDKTEKASSQKLKKAREQGQVVRSKDLATAVGILVSLKLFVFLLPGYLESFRALFRLVYVPLGAAGSMENALSVVWGGAAALLVKMVLPLLGVPLAIVASSVVPGGFVISTNNLMPRFDKFSPVKNLGQLGSAKHWTGVATSVAKAAVLAMVLVHVTRSALTAWVELQRMPLSDALLHGAGLMFDGLMALVAVFLLFALIDVPLQSFLFARGQRMSKQEVKEEYKSNEGKPEVKARIRQLQQQLARRNVNKTVPTADVVIVNPEHYAVALKYDQERAEAPFVVAKGVDEMALYIKSVAAKHKIETITLPPLARAIYNTSQVQQQIPAQLYQAVSQVLNYVLQLNAFRAGRRQAPPRFPNEVAVPAHLSEVSTQ